MTDDGFTKTQNAILAVLSDGQPHTREELHKCLPDDMTELSAVRVHVCNIRKVLRLMGQDIVCELRHRKIHYRHVRVLCHGR